MTDQAQKRLTELLWGVRWSDSLPLAITDDITAVTSCWEQAVPFIETQYPAIFQNQGDTRFLQRGSTDAKSRYYRAVADFFEFRRGDRTVGVLVCTPADWSTYYLRSTGILPEVQDRKLLQCFFPRMFAVLKRAGVERVEADTSPSNLKMLHILLKLGFNPSGTVLTDRWGAGIKFTHFLDDAAEKVFLNQYCTGVSYQQQSRLRPAPDTI